MNPLAQLQLASHITLWGQIPMQLASVNPITHVDGPGPGLHERVSSFANQVRDVEGHLLRSLGVDRAHVDFFLEKNGIYRLLFWQLPLPWVGGRREITTEVLNDMEPLNESLRRLQGALDIWSGGAADEAIKAVGVETNFLRRHLASRVHLARELGPFLESEPGEAVTIFYDDGIRQLRRLNAPKHSLKLYLGGSELSFDAE